MNIHEIIERLESLGYKYEEQKDAYAVEFCINKVTEHIQNFINWDSLPDGLHYTAVDMVVGEFLKLKFGMGQLDMSSLTSLSAQSVKVGDTQITFPTGESFEVRYKAVLEHLLRGYNEDLLRYRKMVW